MDTIINAKHIVRAFPVAGSEPFVALKGIDIQIPTGKLTILRGRSGAGKSTLMNILGALDYPTEGEINFDGQNTVTMTEPERCLLRRQKIGFVFQSVALIPIFTAYENVEFALRLAKYPGDAKKRAEECLRMVGLGNRMTHMPQELSGGEQQRVAIARAIAHKPKVVFADEPTAELDSNTGLQILKVFKELVANEGVSFVMTTHDASIMEFGDCTYELEDGVMISHG